MTLELPECLSLGLRLDGGVLHVTLDRPRVKNAMSLEMVSEMGTVLTTTDRRRDVRAIVLRGAGGTFCAGGDVKDMRSILSAPEDERRGRLQDFSRVFGSLLRRLDRAPQVVIAVVEGSAMGGGFGLACASDVTLATEDARFGLPETTLGLVPAQIAPVIVQRIGLAQTRRLSLTGARFGGREAQELGIVHHLCEDTQALEAKLAEVLDGVLSCGPEANAATKRLLRRLGDPDFLDEASGVFAGAVLGEEGREGTRALVEKRPPRWRS